MTFVAGRPGRTLLLAIAVFSFAAATPRADPFDDLLVAEIPRDVSSNSRIERIQVWGDRIEPPGMNLISPFDVTNITINLNSLHGEGSCINCIAPSTPERDEEADRESILDELKQAAKIIWSVMKRSKGGAVRFIFQSKPLGDYCTDKPQDLACQRNVEETKSLDIELGLGIERHDLTPVVRALGGTESATLFGHPLNAVAGAVFDRPVDAGDIRIDSVLQDDATGTIVLTVEVEDPVARNARPARTSRPQPSPIRIDRYGRVFIEP